MYAAAVSYSWGQNSSVQNRNVHAARIEWIGSGRTNEIVASCQFRKHYVNIGGYVSVVMSRLNDESTRDQCMDMMYLAHCSSISPRARSPPVPSAWHVIRAQQHSRTRRRLFVAACNRCVDTAQCKLKLLQLSTWHAHRGDCCLNQQ